MIILGMIWAKKMHPQVQMRNKVTNVDRQYYWWPGVQLTEIKSRFVLQYSL